MKIILARHADAQNQDGVFHGMNDTPLTRAGQKEAESLADNLEQYKPQIIYSSDRKRARDTAKIVSDSLGIPMRVAKELRPLDLGEFVGKPVDDYTDDVRYFLNNPSEQIPGSTQSVNQWASNYLPFFDQLFNHKSNGSVVFLTHGRNIVLTRAHLKNGGRGFNPKDLADNTDSTDHAGISIAEPPNKFQIVDHQTVAPGRS